MKFNLEEYETVKSRKLRFYADHPDGRIIVQLENPHNIETSALFRAFVFLNADDQYKSMPRGTGYAFELRDTELKTTRDGKQYESVNYTSWCENAEESAVGRALDNSGYASNKKPSREEMEKVERMSKLKKKGDFQLAMDAINKASDILALDTIRNQVEEREWANGEREKLVEAANVKINAISHELFLKEDGGHHDAV